MPSAPAAVQPYIPRQFDKAVHFITFFALSLVFYFIIDTGRRRVLHLTLCVCTLALAVGSEVVQGLLNNGRQFDPWDVLANVVGSLCAIALANAYHKRSLERRRRAKYSALTGDAVEEEDLELGEASTFRHEDGDIAGQESGLIATAPPPTVHRSVEEELDNWDENVPDDDWDDEDDITTGQAKATPATSTADSEDVPKKLAVD